MERENQTNFMRNRFFLYSILLITTFCSCHTNRYIYFASPPNNPYFTKKGESKVAAYYSSSNSNSLTKEFADGFDLQGAYALSNHLALAVSYFNRKEKDVYGVGYNDPFDSSIVRYKRNLIDVGTGYFIALNKKKTITFNFYGGLSLGKFSIDDNGLDKNLISYNRFHSSHITRWFFQPSINFMPGKYVRFSFTLKSSYVLYGKVKTNYTSEELQFFPVFRTF